MLADSVAIEYESSRLEPRQLQAIFEATLPLLLEVFNPQGWCAALRGSAALRRCSGAGSEAARCRVGRLDITYVDEALRVGRDDKGHTFVLERAARADAADAGIAAA